MTSGLDVQVEVEPADGELLQQAAELVGVTLSAFLLDSARERAELLLASRTRPVVADDWGTFCAPIDRPAEVKPVVRELFERPRPV